MEGIRRTIPRSARRPPPKTAPPSSTTPQSYAPTFTTLPPLRTGLETLSGPAPLTYTYTPNPILSAQWLSTGGANATAAIGTGGGMDDAIHIYSVRRIKDGMETRLEQELEHQGKALSMCGTDTLYVGSSDGAVRVVTEKGLTEMIRFERRGAHAEGVAGIATVDGGVCAGGEDGSLIVASEEGVSLKLGQVDGVGVLDVGGGEGGNGWEVVIAGGSGEVGIWDLRNAGRKRGASCILRSEGVCGRVAVDAGRVEYIVGGSREGEIVIWDRRKGEAPVNRVQLHEGPVWGVSVVACDKNGVLLSGGEDGYVWLVDFAAAALRGGADVWEAVVEQADLRDVTYGVKVGVNCVTSHGGADLFVYGTDGGAAAFGSLYS